MLLNVSTWWNNPTATSVGDWDLERGGCLFFFWFVIDESRRVHWFLLGSWVSRYLIRFFILTQISIRPQRLIRVVDGRFFFFVSFFLPVVTVVRRSLHPSQDASPEALILLGGGGGLEGSGWRTGSVHGPPQTSVDFGVQFQDSRTKGGRAEFRLSTRATRILIKEMVIWWLWGRKGTPPPRPPKTVGNAQSTSAQSEKGR